MRAGQVLHKLNHLLEANLQTREVSVHAGEARRVRIEKGKPRQKKKDQQDLGGASEKKKKKKNLLRSEQRHCRTSREGKERRGEQAAR